MDLSHDFSEKFRKEIKHRGVKNILNDILISSQTEKNKLKKAYLSREAAKRACFKQEMASAFLALRDAAKPGQERMRVLALERAILAS